MFICRVGEVYIPGLYFFFRPIIQSKQKLLEVLETFGCCCIGSFLVNFYEPPSLLKNIARGFFCFKRHWEKRTCSQHWHSNPFWSCSGTDTLFPFFFKSFPGETTIFFLLPMKGGKKVVEYISNRVWSDSCFGSLSPAGLALKKNILKIWECCIRFRPPLEFNTGVDDGWLNKRGGVKRK